ncbi:MAG: hypothetical protein Q4D38_03960 [Planctomycetia bacterium]|nr:hypothetical protein [Planctomycetia bacterium]
MTKLMRMPLYTMFIALSFFMFEWAFLPQQAEAQGRRAADVEEEEEAVDEEELDEEEEEDYSDRPIPDPVRLSGQILKTKDGVLLSATYYPGNRGKKSVPIILLHDWSGSRADFETLAPILQAEGYAVLVPDLRGHGRSKQLEVGPEKLEEIKLPSNPTAGYFNEMLNFDLPKLKLFLMKENNGGELNIDKLCVGGIGMGGYLGAYFAAGDWNPRVKRRKENPRMGDVKAFLMISPPKSIRGARNVKFAGALTNANWNANLSCLILCGESNDKLIASPKTLEAQLRKCCSKTTMEESVFPLVVEMDAEGKDLIAAEDSPAVDIILDFLHVRLYERDILWSRR